MRRLLKIITALFLVSVLQAQDNAQNNVPNTVQGSAQDTAQDSGGKDAAQIFPLSLILEEAKFAADCGAWRPDWPAELPPDAFKILSGNISGIGLEGEGLSLKFSYDADGRLAEFPFMLCGNMAQVSLVYGGLEIREMALTFQSGKTEGEGEAPPAASPDAAPDNEAALSGEDNWKLEFLEYKDSFPAVARASCADAWYFIYLKRTGNEIMETWYDEEGNFLGAYGFSLAETGKNMRIRAIKDYRDPDSGPEYFYDSRSFITEISGSAGVYKVLYFRQDLPRYWERRPSDSGGTGETGNDPWSGNYSLQWDAKGVLLRMSGDPDSGDSFTDQRYEYDFDERGNWVSRREIRMIRSLGLLTPVQGTAFKRVLEYGE